MEIKLPKSTLSINKGGEYVLHTNSKPVLTTSKIEYIKTECINVLNKKIKNIL